MPSTTNNSAPADKAAAAAAAPSTSSSNSNSFADALLSLGEVAGFSLGRCLGSGTYGVVLSATKHGKACALKVFKRPVVRTESASLDSAWSSLATEVAALERLGAAFSSSSSSTSTAAAAASSSSFLSPSSSSSSAAPSGIPRLFEYGIFKANSRAKGPGGAKEEDEDDEEGGGNSSVQALDGSAAEKKEKETENDDADSKKDEEKQASSPPPPPPQSPPDAVCYAWMATEILGPDLWHLMRDTTQAAKAKTRAASLSSSSSSANKSDERRACSLACRALLAALAPSMLGALQQVHARGLVHRDIKLDNFCLNKAAAAVAEEWKTSEEKEPSAFLLDFGGVIAAPSLAADSSAVDSASKGKKTCFFGTPEYCSSTAFTGELPPTAAQDVEALGYCLLELWGGGRLPWGEKFRSRRETETARWSSSNLHEMRLARDADYVKAVASGAVPWWLDAWITHSKQQQEVFSLALAAAVARAQGKAAEGTSSSPPLGGGGALGAAAPPGTPNYRLLRSLLKAATAQASAEAEVAQEAAEKGRIVGSSVRARMEE